jgi:hypothetical protein
MGNGPAAQEERGAFFVRVRAAFFGAADILFTLFARTGALLTGFPPRVPELSGANGVPVRTSSAAP